MLILTLVWHSLEFLSSPSFFQRNASMLPLYMFSVIAPQPPIAPCLDIPLKIYISFFTFPDAMELTHLL